jgi:conjugative transfer signal peptidase TraF
MKRWQKGIAVGLSVAGLSGLLLAAGYAMGARINTTRSIPLGLYRTSSAPIAKGAYVLFCPPPAAVFDEAKQRGYIGAGVCPGGYGYLMKRVLAAKDDAVTVTDEGVRVNDDLLPLSAPRKADAAGRPMPRFQADRYLLGPAELLLMSDVSGTSFDGRYFGLIDEVQIRAVIRPVIIW